MVNYGIVGAGYFGADLARSMNKIEDAKVVAVFDPNHGEEVAQELPTVTFAKVDVDQDPSLAGKYGIQSIPHLILFKDGQAVDQISGFVGKDVILEKLNPLL